MSHRREILKHYVMALIAEGYLDPRTGDTATVMRVLAKAIKEDAGSVLRDVAEWIFANTTQHYASKLSKKVESFVGDLAKRGLGELWNDIKKAHARGVDAESRRR